MEMYYQRCEACGVFEYDCFGLEGCIQLEPGYRNAHQRHRDRQAPHERLAFMRLLDHRFHRHDNQDLCL